MKTLAERVKYLVKASGCKSARRAAKMIGMVQPSLYRICAGSVTNPRAESLRIMAEGFGVTVDWLLSGGETPQVVRQVPRCSECGRLKI